MVYLAGINFPASWSSLQERVYNLPYSAPLQAEWIEKPLASEDASVCTFDYVSYFICAWQYKIFKTENSLLKLREVGKNTKSQIPVLNQYTPKD